MQGDSVAATDTTVKIYGKTVDGLPLRRLALSNLVEHWRRLFHAGNSILDNLARHAGATAAAGSNAKRFANIGQTIGATGDGLPDLAVRNPFANTDNH